MSTAELTPQEREEEEAADRARLSSGGRWGGAAPGKANRFGPSFLRMIGLLRPYAVVFVLVSILGAASVALAVSAPWVLGQATNTLFAGVLSMGVLAMGIAAGTGQEQTVAQLAAAGHNEFSQMVAALAHFQAGMGVDLIALRSWVLTALAIYVAAAFLRWVQGYVLNRVMMRTMWRLREQVEAKINALPLSYFDRSQRGELLSRVTNDIDNITQTMQQSLSSALTSILTVVGVLIMMFAISWQLALVALISLPLIAVIFGVIGPRSQRAFGAQWRTVGRLNSRVEEAFSGHALVKLFGREQDAQDQFATENQQLYRSSFVAQFLSSLMMPAMTFVGSVLYVGIAVLGAVLVATGQIRLGEVQAFIQYSQQFTQPLSELGGMASVVQSGTASAERVFALLDAPEQSPDAPATHNSPALLHDTSTRAGAGVIEFDHISFAYLPEQPLITDLSLLVQPGHTVAIVGPTGAGKSTLVNLLMRFYELDSGRILLDGVNIADIPRAELRARTGMVLQDPWLFTGSIRENIRYGRMTATDEEVLAAAQATYVDRFVRMLPDGYDTVLDEDASNISAGEKQLITIARAFIAQPSLLVLDEATSAVDTRTEILVQKAIATLREGRTSFVIAHRLSTIRDADVILVMEAGSIVEQGTHDQLIRAQGTYWRLYQSQFEGATMPEPEEDAI